MSEPKAEPLPNDAPEMNAPEMNAPEVLADDELLVAYLDGELPRDQRDALEDRLIADESLRQRLQSLQRSWDLLDWLPQPPVREQSVQTTLQFVVADLNSHTGGTGTLDQTTSISPGRTASSPWLIAGRRGWLAWCVVPLAIAAITFAGTRIAQQREIARQVADFPVAMDMDAYWIGNNTRLIDDLLASPRWSGVAGDSDTPDIERMIDPISTQSLYRHETGGTDGRTNERTDRRWVTPDRSDLAARLHALPSEQRMTALARWERFNRLEESAKADMRTTAERIRSSETGVVVLDTLRRYIRMREQLSDETIARIESGPRDQRMAAIDSAIDEIITSIGRVTGRNLSEDAVERIDFTVIQIVKARLKAAASEDESSPAQRIRNFIEQRIRRGYDADSAYREFALWTLLRDPNWNSGAGVGSANGTSNGTGTGNGGDSGRGPRMGPPSDRVVPMTQREADMILGMLSTRDLETLQPYDNDPWMRTMIVRDWAVESVRRKMRGVAKPLTLAERYDGLPADRREVLDLMPPETARKTLADGL